MHVSHLTEVIEKRPTFLAIGVFDGVHRGHQQLLQQMAAAARAENARPAVLTFFPHPMTVIHGRAGRLYLCTLEERVALLAQQGVELVITHPFNEEVRQTRAIDFVHQLCHQLALRQLWGSSFGLGYNREGDLEFLRRVGPEKGFTVHHFNEIVTWEGEPVSSSRVRQALERGALAETTGCLGRPYRLTGTVVKGDGRGRTIGVPTANLSVWEEQILPANGVYAAYAWVGGERYAAATNVGVRPTVDGHQLVVEAHLLAFDRDIYGEPVSLDFVARIRDEQKFPGLEALIAQIRADIGRVNELLQL